MKYQITLVAATLAELYASAAEFAASGGVTASFEGDDDAGQPVNTNAPAFDAAGIPWDERIHSSTKGTNADGTWKRRRNTPDAKYEAVMTELRSRTAGQAPAAAPMTAPIPAAPVAAPAPIATPAPIPAAPAPMAAPVAAPVDGMPFNEFMPRMSAAMQAGRFTQEELAGWLGQWGYQQIGQLAADPAKTKQFYEWVKSAGRVD